MITGPRTSKGFVFLAVLGVMAVTILIVFAMSGATQYSYHATGRSLVDVQEQLMVQSAVDYALSLIAQNKMTADGKPQPFAIVADQLQKREVTGEVVVTAMDPNHPIYQVAGFVARPGDVLVRVASPQMQQRYGRGERWLLCNAAGGRQRSVDVTDLLRVLATMFKK